MSFDYIAPVDHRQPIHDQLCRCRACKPPLVGVGRTSLLVWLVAGCIAWGLIAAAVVVAWPSLAASRGWM